MNRLINCDCLKLMRSMPDTSVDFILTDIPYGEVNSVNNSQKPYGDARSIRQIYKGVADEINFSLDDFLPEIYRLMRNSCVIFCGAEQFSIVRKFFKDKGTVRTIVWEKTNPSPMNGKVIYLSGVELAVWCKKKGAKVFNAFCKNTVFHYSIGKSKLHPTEKNHGLLKELIEDNTNPGDLVFDPCAGSGSTLLVAKKLGRRYLGCELYKEFYKKAKKRLEENKN